MANPNQKQDANRLTVNHVGNQRDLAQAVFDRYDTDHPIAIVPVKGKPDTYVVLMSGTEPTNFGQASTLPEDQAASLNLNDRYRENVMHALHESGIKKSDKLIFAGHSLGGMEAQNLVADKEFQKNYTASEVVTFGSPKTAPEQPGVKYDRFATVGDPVIRASPGSLTNLDPGRQIEVSDNRERDLKKVNAGTIDILHHPLESVSEPGFAVSKAAYMNAEAGIDQHMSYPKVQALAKYEVNGNEGLTLDREHMRTFSARRDVMEENIDRMGRFMSAKVTEIYEKQHPHAAAAEAADKPSERRSMAEQMRERSGRNSPEGAEVKHDIRKGR